MEIYRLKHLAIQDQLARSKFRALRREEAKPVACKIPFRASCGYFSDKTISTKEVLVPDSFPRPGTDRLSFTMRTEYTTAGGQTTYGKTQIYQGLFYTADFNTASATVIINDLVYNLRTTEEWALEICQIARPVYYAANIIDLAMKQGLLVLGDITFSSSMVLDTSTPTPKWMVRCAFDVPDPAGGATQHYHYDVLPLSASMTTTGS